MCVLVVLRDPLPGWRLVVAANRDEFRSRSTEGPQILESCAVAGRDLQAGGTWLGVNRRSTVVAVTNRRSPPRSDAYSRGQLVMDVLAGRPVADRPIGGYNLLIAAAADDLLAWEYTGERRERRLNGALHVISSGRDVDDPAAPEGAAVRRQYRPCRTIDELAEHLRAIQASHEGDVCKHSDWYGTLSACLIALHEDGLARSRFYCAPGAPCETPWQDCSHLLRRLT